jgi:hypothetical protein
MVWKCPPLHLPNWNHLWKWKKDMADISMCAGTGCPLKEDCYRHTAKACEYRQSYFCEVPFGAKKQGHCEYFWSTIKDKNESSTV